MHTGNIESDLNFSSWFMSFKFGQSQYYNCSSCVTLFIINDVILGGTESLKLIFTATNEINYLPSRVEVNITIYEDPNDGVLCYILLAIKNIIASILYM